MKLTIWFLQESNKFVSLAKWCLELSQAPSTISGLGFASGCQASKSSLVGRVRVGVPNLSHTTTIDILGGYVVWLGRSVKELEHVHVIFPASTINGGHASCCSNWCLCLLCLLLLVLVCIFVPCTWHLWGSVQKLDLVVDQNIVRMCRALSLPDLFLSVFSSSRVKSMSLLAN